MLAGLVTVCPVAKLIHSVLHVCSRDNVNVSKILNLKECVYSDRELLKPNRKHHT